MGESRNRSLSDIAFERYEALYEQELYREKDKPMWASEHEKAARRKVYEAVIAECAAPSETKPTFADTDLTDRKATEKLVDRASQAAAEAFTAQSGDKRDVLSCPFCLSAGELDDEVDEDAVRCMNVECPLHRLYIARAEWNKRAVSAKGST